VSKANRRPARRFVTFLALCFLAASLTPGVEGRQLQAWSPDGSRIAFDSGRGRNPGGYHDIYVMNADGTKQRRLTYRLRGYNPAWSPDGRRIAFQSGIHPAAIYVMNADGTKPRRVASGQTPAWSPDGRRIAFSNRIGEGDWDIYVMNADGSKHRRLTRTARSEQSPAWSPDGRRIAYSSFGMAGSPSFVYVVDADGSNPRRLAAGYAPGWSPDGRRIAFARYEPPNPLNIYVINADGSHLWKVTNH